MWNLSRCWLLKEDVKLIEDTDQYIFKGYRRIILSKWATFWVEKWTTATCSSENPSRNFQFPEVDLIIFVDCRFDGRCILWDSCTVCQEEELCKRSPKRGYSVFGSPLWKRYIFRWDIKKEFGAKSEREKWDRYPHDARQLADLFEYCNHYITDWRIN